MKKKVVKATARRYLKIIEWSGEDACFVGSAPPLIGQCCHGDSEAVVLRKLERIVEEWIEIHLTDGRQLPLGTAGKTYSGNFLVRVPPKVHESIALKAAARRESLNQYVERALLEA